VIEQLTALEKLRNTVVIFTADNGPETLKRYRTATRSYGRPDPLRGMKLWTTEAGFRVAGIMHWPERIPAGGVSDQPVSSLDFLPTFCRLAGTVPPADLPLDGTNFLPVLDGKPISRPKPLFWCYYNAINQQRVAMRDGQWKVLAKLNGGKFGKTENVHSGNVEAVRAAELTDFEVYRVTEDIGEERDIAGEFPEETAALKQKLQRLYRELTETSHYWHPADEAASPRP
jgi:arylsulfatase A